jgi:hypothetical protein
MAEDKPCNRLLAAFNSLCKDTPSMFFLILFLALILCADMQSSDVAFMLAMLAQVTL